MRAYLLIAAVLLDGLWGEPRRWHPLVGFGRIAQHIEARLNPQCSSGANSLARIRWGYPLGTAAVLLAVGPPVLSAVVLERYQPLTTPIAIGLLYLAIGHRSLHEHAIAVEQALQRNDLPEARRRVGMIVSRDTSDMDRHRIASATVESLLENGNDALFGALLWFLVLGAPGALAYRLVNTLDAMWGYRTDRYRQFGWAAARLDDLMNLLPARLTALSYALAGHTMTALRCWRRQAAAWESPNAGPVMAAGAGALDLRVGGGALYHGRWHERAVLGEGRSADVGDIERARQLVFRALLWWLGAATLCVVSRRLLHA